MLCAEILVRPLEAANPREVIKDHKDGVRRVVLGPLTGRNFGRDLFQLAFTDEGLCRRLLPAADDQVDVDDIGRTHQLNEFSQIVLIWLLRKVDMDQKGSLTPTRTFKFEQRNLREKSYLAITPIVFRMGMVDVYIARRHDCRNRVFIYHLTDVVFQQHDKLVEGLDLSLQLDSIDQEDGNRHMLSS